MGAGEVGIRSRSPPCPVQRLPANQRAPERKERLLDCRPACHSARAGGGTDSTRQTSARPPTATGLGRCRAAFGAQRGVGECDELAAPVGCSRHRRHDRRLRSRDDTEVVLVRLAMVGSHRQAAKLLANRAGWLRSSGRRVACRARRRSNGACSRAWPGRSDSDRSGFHHMLPARSSYRPPPATNQSGRDARASRAARSASGPKYRRLASRATVANTSSRPAAQFVWQHLPRDAAAEHEKNAGETRAIRDARPSTARSSPLIGQERFDEIP
jgi:ribosomal protein L35AE/L33A